jgi:hypothetical protein
MNSRPRKPRLDDQPDDPFVKMRVGILEHVRSKAMDADMFLAFYVLLHKCDWATGVWHGSAGKLAADLNNIWSERKCQRVLEDLAKMQYVVSHHVKGRVGNYDVLINNFQPTTGSSLGQKLRCVNAGKPLSDIDKPDGLTDKSVAANASSPTNLSVSPTSLTVSPTNPVTNLTVSPTNRAPKLATIQELPQEGDQEPSRFDDCMIDVPQPRKRGFEVEEPE